MTTKLIIDDRERAVTCKAELKEIPHEIMRMEQGGDYLLVKDGSILACIERKSLDDFAASIKDGRSENIKKLIAFRAKTNCRIIYLIEGKLNPNPTEEFAHIPYKTIKSSINHLIIRDGVCILRTLDTNDTAKTLVDLVHSMNTLKEFEPLAETPNTTIIGNDEMLTMIREKHVKPTIDVVREMWSCFKGISIDASDSYIAIWSIADIVLARITRETIINHKTSSGRKINKQAATSLMGIDKLLETRILSKIPGISAKSANYITLRIPLATLINLNLEELTKINYTDKKKINVTVAKNILSLFNFHGTN